MVRKVWEGAFALLLVIGIMAPAQAALDASSSVPVRLSFGTQTSLSLEVRNIADNEVTDTLTFNYTGVETYLLSSQYVRLTYGSNLANWKIVTYTANLATTDPLHANWGALVGSDSNNRVALMWNATPDVVTGGPAWGGDATAENHWMYFKDTGDSDYQQTSDSGYTTVVYGSGLAWSNIYYGASETSPTAFYVGALTAGLVPDEYSTAIRFDLLHF